MCLTADLVVPSACRTARGAVVAGEGVRGLAGPFLVAGGGGTVARRLFAWRPCHNRVRRLTSGSDIRGECAATNCGPRFGEGFLLQSCGRFGNDRSFLHHVGAGMSNTSWSAVR